MTSILYIPSKDWAARVEHVVSNDLGRGPWDSSLREAGKVLVEARAAVVQEREGDDRAPSSSAARGSKSRTWPLQTSAAADSMLMSSMWRVAGVAHERAELGGEGRLVPRSAVHGGPDQRGLLHARH
eukprot:CAMPEP_0179375074 /NCGR_PEP_ID=MMETSP0797-20121207/87622_1 /TAXON_ID=47934 /ORGANISM="Dinophysis acuminata, Strain DAEP01" /LENGTH=126 /DNA_ID=CAMNT_0021091083 /DNA_START=57 /DNA_END=435 /DNA_ORIENTATION=-